jgi:hypothetical protein
MIYDYDYLFILLNIARNAFTMNDPFQIIEDIYAEERFLWV